MAVIYVIVLVVVALIGVAMSVRISQTLVVVAVDKNSTVVFPAPLMSTIAALGSFLDRGTAAALPASPAQPTSSPNGKRVLS